MPDFDPLLAHLQALLQRADADFAILEYLSVRYGFAAKREVMIDHVFYRAMLVGLIADRKREINSEVDA